MQESKKCKSSPKHKKYEGKKRICTQWGQPKKKKTRKTQGANLASLLAREKRGGELINDAQRTATCNCEKGERQVEKEDQ